jgi:hypothetical protein
MGQAFLTVTSEILSKVKGTNSNRRIFGTNSNRRIVANLK